MGARWLEVILSCCTAHSAVICTGMPLYCFGLVHEVAQVHVLRLVRVLAMYMCVLVHEFGVR